MSDVEIDGHNLYRKGNEETEESETLLYIEADHTEGESMITHGPAANWRPGAGDEMEITNVQVMLPLFGPFRYGVQQYAYLEVFELTDSEEDNIKEVLFENLSNDIDDAKVEAYLSARDC